MVDKSSILQIFGSLMKHPQFLSETDKYNLDIEDFYFKFDRYVFKAISELYQGGAEHIQPIDVENYLQTNAAGSVLFKQNNGIEYLQDAIALSEEKNFSFYYNHLKKVNLLNRLQKSGIDISEFYIEDITKPNAIEVNKNFEELEISDILESLKCKLLGIEHDFIQNDSTETVSACTGIEGIIEGASEQADVGVPIQGEILNEVMSGARKGAMVVRSAGSGVGKTRQAVGDACYIAYPFRYNELLSQWERCGSGMPTLFIATEQTIPEIQKMILAYLTGFNESKFRYGNFTPEEEKIIKQALWVMKEYENNFFIVQMPNPSIGLVKNLVREQVLLHNIEYVFYDYVFISPSLLSEFKGISLRNDEILLMFSTALKELAVELNIFVMTSTQVNANIDNSSNIRNESSIAGARAIVNKADIGVIMARPTKEDLDFIVQQNWETPNCVTDIYKVRSGEWSQVRIWSVVDLGNLRKRDLYMTDARYTLINNYEKYFAYEVDWEDEETSEKLRKLNGDTWQSIIKK